MLHSIGMTTPAYAHDHELEHGSHVNIIEPIRSIVVYDDHEPWWKDPPEIWLHFTVLLRPNTNDLNVDKFDLKQVNQENENYTQYKYRQSTHGPGSQWNDNYIHEVKVIEKDPCLDDEVCTWQNINCQYWLTGQHKTLPKEDGVNPDRRDARIVMRKLYRP